MMAPTRRTLATVCAQRADSTREHEGENDHGDRHFEHDPRDEQELLGDARAIHHPRDHLLQLPGTEQFVNILKSMLMSTKTHSADSLDRMISSWIR